MVNISTEIPTEHLVNASSERHFQASLFGISVVMLLMLYTAKGDKLHSFQAT
jgi:hypothetical protein